MAPPTGFEPVSPPLKGWCSPRPLDDGDVGAAFKASDIKARTNEIKARHSDLGTS